MRNLLTNLVDCVDPEMFTGSQITQKRTVEFADQNTVNIRSFPSPACIDNELKTCLRR